MSLQIREVVNTLCCTNGWCYGLFWGVNRRNPMLLTIEDAYCEETAFISTMLQQVHMLGEGIIGEAAVTGKHQWMFSDTSYRVSGPTGSVNNQEVFQDISEFHRHFSSGIKTILLIPVPPLGVVQFGSTHKILESLEFVDHVKYLFQHFAPINTVGSHHGGYDTSSRVGSETSFPNYVVNHPLNIGDSVNQKHRENIQTPIVVPPELQNSDSNPLMCGTFHIQNQFPDMQDPQQFSSTSANTPESMWSSGQQSSWTLFDQQMLSGEAVIDNSLTPVACVNSFLNSQGDTGLSTIISNVLDNTSLPVGFKLVDSQPSVPFETPPHMFPSDPNPSSVTLASNHNSADKNVMATDTLSVVDNPGTNNIDSLGDDSLGLDFGQNQRMECWDDYVWPVVSASHSSLSTGASECTDLDGAAPQQKEFLTDFRLDQLLQSAAISNNSEDQLSPTTTTPTPTPTPTPTGSALLLHNNQINLATYSQDESFLEYSKMMRLNALVSPSIDDNYSINTETTSSSRHSKKPEETAKAPKRKGQPREGSRPRPKDRQQIQDRVKELREIVPTGGKCSIDALLDRTIKHLLFLQSVLKYTDKLKNFDDPKIIGDEKGVVLKDTSNGSDAIWAYGVAGQNMVCPMAEDMSPPCELSIEMRCDEGGYFLEIADTIRGFGLTILRGVMETEDDTIWARFTIEVTKDVTRMDIFLFLVQLVQQTTTGGNNSKNQLSKGTFPNYQAITSPVGPSG